jgi:hypothetical protein
VLKIDFSKARGKIGEKNMKPVGRSMMITKQILDLLQHALKMICDETLILCVHNIVGLQEICSKAIILLKA